MQLLLVSVGRTQRVGLLLATGELDIAKPTWMIVAYSPRTAIVEYCSYIYLLYIENFLTPPFAAQVRPWASI